MKWKKIRKQPKCSTIGADSVTVAHTPRGAPSWGSSGGRGSATASEPQQRVSMSGLFLDEDAEHHADTNDYETEPLKPALWGRTAGVMHNFDFLVNTFP